ncbi:PREDICTED: uncharacterized protein At1g08160-like [Ipomoea nil]|uniref:uncharacterized protein At1g08160-like n=1 Tax=Ipomoea nil TaxID=35883 RepID=UPI000901749F|nr:PREDICTED: uncharacterized protein At1g08160-like [Ipomoea nil]
MAPPSSAVTARRPRRFKPLTCIAIFLLGVIVVVGLAILIAWLVIRPRRLVYAVENATIQNYTLTSNNRLTATFNFTLEAFNPNTHAAVYYDAIEAQLFYDDQLIADHGADPFLQPHRNVTHLDLSLPAKDVAVNANVARDFKVERTNGNVELELRVYSKVRLKVGVWKSGHRKLKVICSLVVFFSSKGFDNSYCDVYM